MDFVTRQPDGGVLLRRWWDIRAQSLCQELSTATSYLEFDRLEGG